MKFVASCLAIVLLFLELSALAAGTEDESRYNIALFAACQNGRDMDVRHLIHSGANPNISFHEINRQGIEEDFYSFVGLNLEDLENKFEMGEDDEVAGVRPLHMATLYGHVETMRALLQAGADVNGKDDIGYTPLFYAIDTGNYAATHLLMEYKADFRHISEADGQSVLHLAASKGLTDLVSLLLANNVGRVDQLDRFLMSPVHCAVSSGRADVVRAFMPRLRQGQLNRQIRREATPLHIACDLENKNPWETPKICGLLLEQKADHAINDRKRRQPLHLASARQNTPVVGMLVNETANANAQDWRGRTPLHYLAESKTAHTDPASLQTLLRAGADPVLGDFQKAPSSPVHSAIRSGVPGRGTSFVNFTRTLAKQQFDRIVEATTPISFPPELVKLVIEYLYSPFIPRGLRWRAPLRALRLENKRPDLDDNATMMEGVEQERPVL